jgi:hypothetical protein
MTSYAEPDASADVVETPADQGSLLARIKARRETLVADETLDLPIPTWGGDLVARYRVLDRKEIETLTTRNGKPTATADLDFLIRSCVGISMRDDEGELVALIDQTGPVRFDARLAGMLDIDAMTARDVVQYLFRANAVAVGAHAQKIAEWMQDTSQAVDGALTGER